MSHDPVNAKKMRKDITPYLIFTIPLVFMMIFLMYRWLDDSAGVHALRKQTAAGAFSLDRFTKFFTSSMYKKA